MGYSGHGADRGDDAGLPGLRVDRLAPDDWLELRTVRLSALREAPQAFLSEHSHEAGWLEDDWRCTLQRAQWVVARTADRVIGVARSSGADDDESKERHIEAVWVAPQFRRHGVGRRLVLALVEGELRAGIRDILIWVIDGNQRARRLYEGIGFAPTGERQLLPGKVERYEVRLKLLIGS